MNKKYFSLFVLALATVTLTACSSEALPENTEEWSSDTMPSENAGTENTVEKDSTEPVSTETENSSESTTEIQEGTWTLDTNKSTVSWTGSKVVGNSHTGTVDVKSGNLIVDAEGPTGGEFTLDMKTITETTNDATFLEHMKSDDFFSVAKHPEAKFVITGITPAGADKFEVKGDLTIRGITKPIDFDATAQYDETEKNLSVTAAFQIDRTQWDIKFDSSSFVQNLGDSAIKDEIDFELDLGFYL